MTWPVATSVTAASATRYAKAGYAASTRQVGRGQRGRGRTFPEGAFCKPLMVTGGPEMAREMHGYHAPPASRIFLVALQQFDRDALGPAEEEKPAPRAN